MKLTHVRIFWPMIALISSVFLFCGCRAPELISKWRDREIVVDGMDLEWQDCRLFYDQDTRTSIGMFNDAQYLYICVVTSDRKLQHRILGQGLMVWFDPHGGKAETFGIRFPLVFQDEKPSMRDRDSGGHSVPFRGISNPSLSELEICLSGRKEDRLTLSMKEAESFGISARVANSKGRLVYELKIPLTPNKHSPYAIGPQANTQLGIGFQTDQMDRGKNRSPDGQIESRNGNRGRKGGGGRGKGGRTGGRSGERPEPFELWTKVQLAGHPDPMTRGCL